ncbi:hypothetical protein J2X65_004263 [Ancylobacter sp. 3268]|uniref:hypothetical protein n=1 Tax=Ancylobacter sp. 3268 TaxID=2817752 RepID=UPI002863103B|nr:hypothetical protein [Ancylobacter sp. 3268]MDR6954887.1 hypothetical protein [Ancylobacter sp. 3268]
MPDNPAKHLADQWIAIAVAHAFDRLSGAATPPLGVLAIERAPAGAGGSKSAAPSSSGPLALDTTQIISEPRDTTSTDAPALNLVESLAVIAAHRSRPVVSPEPFSDPLVALRGALDLLEHGTPREHVAALIRHFLAGHADRLDAERLAALRPEGSVQ